MRFFKQFFVLLFLFLFSISTFAADTLKIGVVDLQKIMQNATRVKHINADLKKKYDQRKSTILSKQNALKTKIKNFQRDSAVMKASKRDSLQQKIANEERDFQRMQQDFQQDLAADQNRMMQEFLTHLKDVVETYSRGQGYDLVLQKDAVPYTSERVDITDNVLKKLNAAG